MPRAVAGAKGAPHPSSQERGVVVLLAATGLSTDRSHQAARGRLNAKR